MTRIAIFGDIHGNIEALRAVLADIDASKVDALYCLGDLVGYGASPNEVIDLVRERDIPTIMGNYDDGVGYDRDDCGCAYKDADERERGQQSLMWTRAHVDAERKAWLRTLAPEIRLETEGHRLRLVHGSPRRMNEYLFADRDERSLARIAGVADATCSSSATRTSRGTAPSGACASSTPAASASRRMAIPAPAGCCWRSCRTDIGATMRRVDYDVASAAAAIRAARRSPRPLCRRHRDRRNPARMTAAPGANTPGAVDVDTPGLLVGLATPPACSR